MLLTRRPPEAAIRAFLNRQADLPLSYAEVRATRGPRPSGYDIGRARADLGTGAAVYGRARRAVARWAMFEVGWVTLCWPDDPPREGRTVAVLASVARLWSLNACRVVDTFDENGELERFGFAYGTLPDHMEQGEERFEVVFDPRDERVTYEVMAFSRPNHWLARVGAPAARRLQARFRADSARAMERAVAAPS